MGNALKKAIARAEAALFEAVREGRLPVVVACLDELCIVLREAAAVAEGRGQEKRNRRQRRSPPSRARAKGGAGGAAGAEANPDRTVEEHERRSALLHAVDSNGCTALHVACSNRTRVCILLLPGETGPYRASRP